MPGDVELRALTKRYEETLAVDAIDASINDGEFFSLLGPSGCGKTTTLRLIAGFERPTSGDVRLDGASLAAVPPDRRNVNTVFQSYALFPFLSVQDNVAFGLRYQKVPKAGAAQRVGDALAMVQLSGYEKRRPGQLSGGQQQRVALARALVLNPAVLLLDEPLGALDAKLRRTLQVELKALQETVGITFLYVTHDQEEALTMSDRLAVMEGGRIAQIGTPRQVYEEPADAYVADFLGVSNLMDARAVCERPAGVCQVRLGDFDLTAETGSTAVVGPVKLAIRPERVRVLDYGVGGPNHVPGMVERLVFLGAATQLLVRLAPGERVQALVHNHGDPIAFRQGSAVQVHLPPDALRVLPPGATVPADEEAAELLAGGPAGRPGPGAAFGTPLAGHPLAGTGPPLTGPKVP